MNYRAERLALSNAERDVQDSATLRALIGSEENVSECLARCFKNLDRACKGDPIARDAITTALHNLHTELVALRAEIIYEDCVEVAMGENV